MSDSPEEPDPDLPHRDDGLDLARDLARGTAERGSPAARPRRRRDAETPGPAPGSHRWSGAHPDERDPQLLAGEVSRLIDGRGWDLPLRLRGVFARWAELVGPEVAAHSTPESFDDGRLVVRTDSSAWATQLKLLAPRLLARLNEDLGSGTVTIIDVQGPRAPRWTHGRLRTRDGRGPRDTYG